MSELNWVWRNGGPIQFQEDIKWADQSNFLFSQLWKQEYRNGVPSKSKSCLAAKEMEWNHTGG